MHNGSHTFWGDGYLSSTAESYGVFAQIGDKRWFDAAFREGSRDSVPEIWFQVFLGLVAYHLGSYSNLADSTLHERWGYYG